MSFIIGSYQRWIYILYFTYQWQYSLLLCLPNVKAFEFVEIYHMCQEMVKTQYDVIIKWLRCDLSGKLVGLYAWMFDHQLVLMTIPDEVTNLKIIPP